MFVKTGTMCKVISLLMLNCKRLSEDDGSNMHRMKRQLKQLQEAIYEKQSTYVGGNGKIRNPQHHLGNREVSTTKRLHHHRPIIWVVALHKEDKREELRLAYVEAKTELHRATPR